MRNYFSFDSSYYWQSLILACQITFWQFLFFCKNTVIHLFLKVAMSNTILSQKWSVRFILFSQLQSFKQRSIEFGDFIPVVNISEYKCNHSIDKQNDVII